MARYTNMPATQHPHDCDRCIPLGTVEHVHGATPGGVAGEDLYACPREDGDYDLIHRFGPNEDYGSLPMSVVDRLYVPRRVNGTPTTELYVEVRYRLAAHLKQLVNA